MATSCKLSMPTADLLRFGCVRHLLLKICELYIPSWDLMTWVIDERVEFAGKETLSAGNKTPKYQRWGTKSLSSIVGENGVDTIVGTVLMIGPSNAAVDVNATSSSITLSQLVNSSQIIMVS